MSDAAGVLSRALREAPPDMLVEAADRTVRVLLDARGAEVLLADYRSTGLWPVRRPAAPDDDAPVDAAHRCYGAQREVLAHGDDDSCLLYLPLTAWGERLGVLVVDFATAPSPEVVRRAQELAGDLATALRAADRDTDRYRRARRRERLSMAAEMQWDLLPGRSAAHEAYRLAGQLEPAYTVGGDHFDWAINGDDLCVTVLNGDGTGLAASLLTSVAVNAMRNARRSGGGLVEQAELASDTIYSQYRGRRHVATLLLELDVRTGRLGAVDAGSPRAVLLRGTSVRPLRLEQQLPLGMFAETRYEVQELLLQPGDRLFVVSDGVYSAEPGGREPYGRRAMARAMRAACLQPATEAVGTVIRELHAYHDRVDLRDDAVVVCLDWFGGGRDGNPETSRSIGDGGRSAGRAGGGRTN
ncbi:PP2C family protein-serine/threonine phosphatase [Micromonospora sp. CPCC 206060]|uniref:PP2C family protein-serine/threonine phosphatase n=1 Tax=Micromonospora sp. CPCC 206060 TaxID=3122406 RepID=UPI002FEFDC56